MYLTVDRGGMMLDWNGYREQVQAAVTELAKHGANREEIVEALGVAIAVNALIYSTRLLEAFAATVPVLDQ